MGTAILAWHIAVCTGQDFAQYRVVILFSLVDVKFLEYRPSILSLASIFVALQRVYPRDEDCLFYMQQVFSQVKRFVVLDVGEVLFCAEELAGAVQEAFPPTEQDQYDLSGHRLSVNWENLAILPSFLDEEDVQRDSGDDQVGYGEDQRQNGKPRHDAHTLCADQDASLSTYSALPKNTVQPNSTFSTCESRLPGVEDGHLLAGGKAEMKYTSVYGQQSISNHGLSQMTDTDTMSVQSETQHEGTEDSCDLTHVPSDKVYAVSPDDDFFQWIEAFTESLSIKAYTRNPLSPSHTKQVAAEAAVPLSDMTHQGGASPIWLDKNGKEMSGHGSALGQTAASSTASCENAHPNDSPPILPAALQKRPGSHHRPVYSSEHAQMYKREMNMIFA